MRGREGEWWRGDSRENVKEGRVKNEVWGGVSTEGVVLEANQRLMHSWGLAGPKLFFLGCLLAGSCSEECTGACLWKAEAMTSSSLTVAQSGNCLSWKKRGMEQECRKKPITLSSSVPSGDSFFLCRRPSISHRLPSINSFWFSTSPSLLLCSLQSFIQSLCACPLQVFNQGKEKVPVSSQADFTWQTCSHWS